MCCHGHRDDSESEHGPSDLRVASFTTAASLSDVWFAFTVSTLGDSLGSRHPMRLASNNERSSSFWSLWLGSHLLMNVGNFPGATRKELPPPSQLPHSWLDSGECEIWSTAPRRGWAWSQPMGREKNQVLIALGPWIQPFLKQAYTCLLVTGDIQFSASPLFKCFSHFKLEFFFYFSFIFIFFYYIFNVCISLLTWDLWLQHIFRCTVEYCWLQAQCCATDLQSLCVLHNRDFMPIEQQLLILPLPAFGNQHTTLCFYEFNHFLTPSAESIRLGVESKCGFLPSLQLLSLFTQVPILQWSGNNTKCSLTRVVPLWQEHLV